MSVTIRELQLTDGTILRYPIGGCDSCWWGEPIAFIDSGTPARPHAPLRLSADCELMFARIRERSGDPTRDRAKVMAIA
jgi:hypothetical protein